MSGSSQTESGYFWNSSLKIQEIYINNATCTYTYLYICIYAFSQRLVNCESSLRSVVGLSLNRSWERGVPPTGILNKLMWMCDIYEWFMNSKNLFDLE